MSGNSSNELFQIHEGQSRSARNPKRIIPKAKCFEILDDCKEMDVKAIQFTGGGEPTIHPDFCEIVGYAQELGFETALVTNGNMLVRDEHLDVCQKMKWVRVSVDAGTPKYYMNERGVGRGAWERMLVGVKSLTALVAHSGSETLIGAGFVVTPGNWREIPEAVALYRELGFHNVRLGLMFSPDNSAPYARRRVEIEALAEETTRLFTAKNFQVINRVSEKLHELDVGHPEFEFCSYQHFTSYLAGDLNVYRCCILAYNSRGIVGNLEHQRFKSLWDSPKKVDNFDTFNARGCERCQFMEIIEKTNAHIDSSVDKVRGPLPPHHNFT